MTAVIDTIREVIRDSGVLPVAIATLADTDDLYAAGLKSHAAVNLMLGLEDKFDIEFPDRLLNRQTFESVDALGAAVTQLLNEKVAA